MSDTGYVPEYKPEYHSQYVYEGRPSLRFMHEFAWGKDETLRIERRRKLKR